MCREYEPDSDLGSQYPPTAESFGDGEVAFGFSADDELGNESPFDTALSQIPGWQLGEQSNPMALTAGPTGTGGILDIIDAAIREQEAINPGEPPSVAPEQPAETAEPQPELAPIQQLQDDVVDRISIRAYILDRPKHIS